MRKEYDNVMAVVQEYIEATFKADIETLKKVFHKEARMTGYLGDQLVISTPEPFYEDLQSRPSMYENKDPYRADIILAHVNGNMANVIFLETGFFGDGTIETHFHLVKDGEWKITSKSFTTM